ncbi:hypothetical protein BKA82DRAFT_2443789 [Pisolithus tinctorius]|nr:hypothetical protein BKA82DRAFT_2443789 [Pisolithus tinctorius]
MPQGMHNHVTYATPLWWAFKQLLERYPSAQFYDIEYTPESLADCMPRLVLRHRLGSPLFHSLQFLFVIWLLKELVDVLTGESLPWFIFHLLLHIFLPTESNLDAQEFDRRFLAQPLVV